MFKLSLCVVMMQLPTVATTPPLLVFLRLLFDLFIDAERDAACRR